MAALMLTPLAQLQDSSSWIALGVGIAAIAFVLFRSRSRTKKDPLARPQHLSLAQQRSTERQMQNLLVELSEMARQITAQLDTRATKLELLIKEADEKITALQQAASSSPSIEADPRHAAIYDLADQGQSPAQIAMKLDRPKGEIELILALRPK
jgi:hypothetical protein